MIDIGYIPRIVEEISYITVPAGDIPNLQVDGWCFAFTEGIPITDGLTISVHMMSLPTSRLVWHCPFVVIYYSDDTKARGRNYREFSLTRYDGECWSNDSAAKSRVLANKGLEFGDCEKWKGLLKEGVDCEIAFHLDGRNVSFSTEAGGLSIISFTMINDDVPVLFAALTGDQCAITNIRIIRK